MNQHRGDVSLKLGETEYTLRPTFEALSEIERLTGMGLIPLVMKFRTLDFTLAQLKAIISEGIKASGAKVPGELGALILEETPTVLAPQLAVFLSNAISGGSKNGEAPGDQA